MAKRLVLQMFKDLKPGRNFTKVLKVWGGLFLRTYLYDSNDFFIAINFTVFEHTIWK
jgi:hypothetical protein